MFEKVNKEGILSLVDTMFCDAERYDQGTFGDYKHDESEDQESCGNTCCMAGFAYAKQIGLQEFNKEVASDGKCEIDSPIRGLPMFPYKCIQAGKKMLGINESVMMPSIFGTVGSSWPYDLYEEYKSADSQKGRVLVALKALSRLTEDGNVSRLVQTEIPQIKQLEEQLNPSA